MDFHNIDMQGHFKLVAVADASVLSWIASDETKIIYDETTEDLWMADDIEWKFAGQYSDTPLGTEMWIYANAAPDGWDISAGMGDDLIAVKGGSYAVGGTVDGNWSTPSHAHTLGLHGHSFSGSTTGYIGSLYSGRQNGNEIIHATHTHAFSDTLDAPTPPSTVSNGSKDTYRPESRVGLICERI
jgi:hypothetical protein